MSKPRTTSSSASGAAPIESAVDSSVLSWDGVPARDWGDTDLSGVLSHIRQVFAQSPTLCRFLQTHPEVLDRWTILTSTASAEGRCTTIVLEENRVLAVDHTADQTLTIRVVLDELTEMAHRFGHPEVRRSQRQLLAGLPSSGATLQAERG